MSRPSPPARPASASPRADAPAPLQPPGQALTGATGAPLAILMAEDNPTNQLITRRMLEAFGYRVETVSDGAQAVRAAASRQFDLILMDVFMPELDGVAAARAIRAAGQGGDVPILAVSGNADEATRLDCAAAGMNGFLPKPFTRAVLHAAIRDVLGGSAPADDRRAERPDS